MSGCQIDHITVTAPSLASGAALVRDVLGIAPQPGGQHPRMGTHNLLLRLGDALFLEVIAPDPAAPPPDRPRWFGLDRLAPQAAPSLATWVVRSADIHASLAAASEALGNVEPMSRGALSWLITIPSDGSLPLGGVAPALIEWHVDIHPAARLRDDGLSLSRLELVHPEPERISRLLASLALDAPVSVTAAAAGALPQLIAHIHTPQGLRLLSVASPR